MLKRACCVEVVVFDGSGVEDEAAKGGLEREKKERRAVDCQREGE